MKSMSLLRICGRVAASARSASTSLPHGASAALGQSENGNEPTRNLINEVPSAETLKTATVEPSLLKPYIQSRLHEPDHFGLEELVRLDEMFDARLHFGHKMGTLHPNMKWALYGERLGVCVFDLDITRKFLIRALNFVAHVASRGGILLFVTSHRESMLEVESMAEQIGQYSHVRRWQEGTLTNTRQLLGTSVRLPDTMIFLSALSSIGEQHPAIIEAAKMAIPTIGVVDSNADPAYLTYLIPANDDSPPSVAYLLRLFKEAVLRGQTVAKKEAI